ncbi:hypothetical protein [Marinithermus hydrothermalis]|uniref:Uncharacterized protein n=1 Tax=Marinithermus hydrothermalis (strain DSM 14884 / JCM 11576 / T1) TaxID=869210 RepID=F2NN33_MARHT|nr:hypothetical protein [Marinithermus hydrothermalis]AEB12772.1 hypothetical protein Marky_2046 [Marinithermus hydrothermalis DSM 14884]
MVLLEVVVILGLVGAVLALITARPAHPSAPYREELERIQRALAEIQKRGRTPSPTLRAHVTEARRMARTLERLARKGREVRRFLARGRLDPEAKARLEAYQHEIERKLQEGVRILERLAAELLIWEGPEAPEGFAGLEDFRVSLSEVLKERPR